MLTPEQVIAALQNHHRPYRTNGAKLRDALLHVSLSQNVENPGAINTRAFEISVGTENEYGQQNFNRP